jgi:hypothetical protein
MFGTNSICYQRPKGLRKSNKLILLYQYCSNRNKLHHLEEFRIFLGNITSPDSKMYKINIASKKKYFW